MPWGLVKNIQIINQWSPNREKSIYLVGLLRIITLFWLSPFLMWCRWEEVMEFLAYSQGQQRAKKSIFTVFSWTCSVSWNILWSIQWTDIYPAWIAAQKGNDNIVCFKLVETMTTMSKKWKSGSGLEKWLHYWIHTLLHSSLEHH